MMLKILPSPRGTVLSKTFGFVENLPSSPSPHDPTMTYRQQGADALV
jgi:hypothetical protein